VYNIDILVKRIHSVFGSNDPLARALAIRAFGSMEEVLADKPRVHSDVRNALRSPNDIEVRACVRCVHALSRSSETFAEESLPIIAGMVTALETPHDVRTDLLLSLAHMHRSPTAALGALRALEDALRDFPLEGLATSAVQALAALTARSRIGVERVVRLLLRVLAGDARARLRLAAAAGLARVAPQVAGLSAFPCMDVLAAATDAGAAGPGPGSSVLSAACLPLLAAAARTSRFAADAPFLARLRELLAGEGPAAGAGEPPQRARGRRLATVVLAHLVHHDAIDGDPAQVRAGPTVDC
jgi:hypothetical protein